MESEGGGGGGGYKFDKVCQDGLIQVIHTDVALLYGHRTACEIMIMSKHNRYLKVLNARGGSDNPFVLSAIREPAVQINAHTCRTSVKYQAGETKRRRCTAARRSGTECEGFRLTGAKYI